MVGHRMVFHILTAEGDLKDIYAIPTEYTPMWGNGDVRDNIYKSLEEMTAIISNLQVRDLKITNGDPYSGPGGRRSSDDPIEPVCSLKRV